MPSTVQTFAGSPIFTVTEDGVGILSGYTFVDCPPEERELQADGSWFWKYRR